MFRLPLACLGLLSLGVLDTLPGSSLVEAAETQPTVSEPAPSEGAAPAADATSEDAASDDALSMIDYVFPDVPPNRLGYDGENLSIRPIIAVVTDYTVFEQDDSSLAQVGKQGDTRDLRAARLGLILRSKRERNWEFYFAADYQEQRTREDATFRLYDLRLRIPFGRVNLDIGKQKQPFAFEIVPLSILNPQQERILSPFFVTRSVGIKASGQMAGDRVTWSAGWFNDWLESSATFSDNANDYVARVTGLVTAAEDDRHYLHLGLGARRAGPDAGEIRLSGRPESNVADRYVDTGEFAASHAEEIGLELVWGRGPFMLLAEHIEARTHAPESGDPRFSGGYLTLAWMLTGESRPYIRSAGMTGPITPFTHRGAMELVARYSHLDLTDGAIDGGVLDKWHFGFNWWSSRQWKAGVSYGDADLDRGGTTGNTRMLLFRLQWYY